MRLAGIGTTSVESSGLISRGPFCKVNNYGQQLFQLTSGQGVNVNSGLLAGVQCSHRCQGISELVDEVLGHSPRGKMKRKLKLLLPWFAVQIAGWKPPHERNKANAREIKLQRKTAL